MGLPSWPRPLRVSPPGWSQQYNLFFVAFSGVRSPTGQSKFLPLNKTAPGLCCPRINSALFARKQRLYILGVRRGRESLVTSSEAASAGCSHGSGAVPGAPWGRGAPRGGGDPGPRQGFGGQAEAADPAAVLPGVGGPGAESLLEEPQGDVGWRGCWGWQPGRRGAGDGLWPPHCGRGPGLAPAAAARDAGPGPPAGPATDGPPGPDPPAQDGAGLPPAQRDAGRRHLRAGRLRGGLGPAVRHPAQGSLPAVHPPQAHWGHAHEHQLQALLLVLGRGPPSASCLLACFHAHGLGGGRHTACHSCGAGTPPGTELFAASGFRSPVLDRGTCAGQCSVRQGSLAPGGCGFWLPGSHQLGLPVCGTLLWPGADRGGQRRTPPGSWPAEQSLVWTFGPGVAGGSRPVAPAWFRAGSSRRRNETWESRALGCKVAGPLDLKPGLCARLRETHS